MAIATLEHPIASISGRLCSRSNVILRTRNGKTQTYIIQNPYKGPLAPNRKRTINAFKEAVNQSKEVLNDPAQKAEWQKLYNKHKDYFRRHPSSSNKRYSTLRGFVIAQLTQQINVQAKQQQTTDNQIVITATTGDAGASPAVKTTTATTATTTQSTTSAEIVETTRPRVVRAEGSIEPDSIVQQE